MSNLWRYPNIAPSADRKFKQLPNLVCDSSIHMTALNALGRIWKCHAIYQIAVTCYPWTQSVNENKPWLTKYKVKTCCELENLVSLWSFSHLVYIRYSFYKDTFCWQHWANSQVDVTSSSKLMSIYRDNRSLLLFSTFYNKL